MDFANQRIHIPIHHSSNNSKDTTVQWINDPINGSEKYRMKINIEGFNQNEVTALSFLFLIARFCYLEINRLIYVLMGIDYSYTVSILKTRVK
jgi:hypothetical protein